MRDFFEILNNMNLYKESDFQKGNVSYTLNGNVFEFKGVDSPQKKRGQKRHILFCNEANELSKEDFMQLELRTTEQIYIDFNPSMEYHWIYEDVLTRPDTKFIRSTYKDNPFLDRQTIERIERLQAVDPVAWQVYGLGEKAMSLDLVFPTFEIAEIPDGAKRLATGCDFGFTNDPTAVIDVWRRDDTLYLDQLLYNYNLTNQDISQRLGSITDCRDDKLDRRQALICDAAEPKSIEELYRLGWNAKPCQKPRDSVNAGIQLIKNYKIVVTARSVDLIKELRNYKWVKDKEGRNQNVPQDLFNHGCDAFRYAVFTTLAKRGSGQYHLR